MAYLKSNEGRIRIIQKLSRKTQKQRHHYKVSNNIDDLDMVLHHGNRPFKNDESDSEVSISV